jgi:hypothetical protein
MSPLSAAEAWALAAKVYAVEAQRSGPQERAELREHAAALLEHARKLDDSADLIVRAQDYLESPVKPAAHYDRTRRQELAQAKLHALAEKCGPLPTSMLCIGTKPSRRRGTKPASLAQTMAAACHTLKEP